jgi:hypothetical protein
MGMFSLSGMHVESLDRIKGSADQRKGHSPFDQLEAQCPYNSGSPLKLLLLIIIIVVILPGRIEVAGREEVSVGRRPASERGIGGSDGEGEELSTIKIVSESFHGKREVDRKLEGDEVERKLNE